MFLLRMCDRAEKWYVHASFLPQHAFAVCGVSAHHRWIWLTFQDRCNEEFTNIGGMQRVPLSRQLSIRFSQQRKLTLSRNTTNRWRSATRKVRVCKAVLSFALCTVRASTLAFLLFYLLFVQKFVGCLSKAWGCCRIFVSLPSPFFNVVSWLSLLVEQCSYLTKSYWFSVLGFYFNLYYNFELNLLLVYMYVF